MFKCPLLVAPVLGVVGLLLAAPAVCARGNGTGDAGSPAASYYPHWVSRDGTVTPEIMGQLASGTIIAVHHQWPLADIRDILDYPGKDFQVAWYAESNVREQDDPTPVGTPVATRIDEARRKQATLRQHYGRRRFADLIELDGGRDKKNGELSGPGNGATDWMADARAVQRAGFRYIAKNLSLAHVRELRAALGADFVPRIVFEDVTASPGASNAGYRADARAFASDRAPVTLIIHQGTYGGFPGTPLARAHSVLAKDFAADNFEAYWGRPSGFLKLQSLGPRPAASARLRLGG